MSIIKFLAAARRILIAKGIYIERRDIIKDVYTNIDMVVICKNWQALPVMTSIIKDCPRPKLSESSYMPPPDPIQWPTADVVELNEINHDEPNEPTADTYSYSSCPPPVWPKKRLWIIEQRGLLNQFSFSSSLLVVGGAVLAGLVFIMSAGKGTVVCQAPIPL